MDRRKWKIIPFECITIETGGKTENLKKMTTFQYTHCVCSFNKTDKH